MHPILYMLKTILIVIGLLLLAVAGLSIRIIFEKDGRFGSEDVGASRAMRDRGIHCNITEDRLTRKRYAERKNAKH